MSRRRGVELGSWLGGVLLFAGPALQTPAPSPTIDPKAAVLLNRAQQIIAQRQQKQE